MRKITLIALAAAALLVGLSPTKTTAKVEPVVLKDGDPPVCPPHVTCPDEP